MTEPSGSPQGFSDGQSFQYDGKLDSIPDWADRGWATYDRGPALAVPRGDPARQPYTTVVARVGDFVFVNKKGTRFTVMRAEEMGEEPGNPNQQATTERPLPAKPVGTEHASLEDLDRTEILPYEQMNDEQKGQMMARGTAPPEAQEEAEGRGRGRGAEAPEQPAPRRRRKSEEE